MTAGSFNPVAGLEGTAALLFSAIAFDAGALFEDDELPNWLLINTFAAEDSSSLMLCGCAVAAAWP